MARRHGNHDERMRLLIAQEAARLMAGGVRDYGMAKRKAAAHLGAPDTRNLPSNTEVEAELASYQRLFHGQRQQQGLRRMREAALEAMRFFDRFQPRLAGSVLSGTAGPHSDVNLHLFAAAPEEVILHLIDAEIPFEDGERRLRFERDNWETFPTVRFLAGEVPIEAVIFPLTRQRQAPRSPLDGKPMTRASRARVEALLEEAADAGAQALCFTHRS
ncbi:hypothetical protein [Thiohalobacter sp.]|uniref:hypothetical protein n=1 Tax=Thiohalobacter sp. TaxID=2025948 RepID=UPI0026079E2D|nr:hypothetical protein [Thiohalobacter sp.]